jgi:hypothetical protein
MRVDQRLLNWGVFFVLLGLVPLAAQQGYLPPDRLLGWSQLWPLLLIGAGLGLILRGTLLEGLGGLVVAATFGIALGGLIASGGDFGSFGACGDERGSAAFPQREGRFEGAGKVEIAFDCGELQAVAEEGSTWRVAGTDGEGTGPAVEATATELSVRDQGSDRAPFGFLGTRDSWLITLPAGPALDIDASANAGEATFDLRATQLAAFGLSINAGSARVDLGGSQLAGPLAISVNAGSGRLTLPDGSFSGNLSVNAGSLRICAPEGAALRIVMDENITGSNNFEARGLAQNDTTYESPGFATATDRITLEASANAGSIALNPDGGCS